MSRSASVTGLPSALVCVCTSRCWKYAVAMASAVSARACSRFGSLDWEFAGGERLGLVVVEGGAW
jgi:hypothetical protein